jgi:hypothetical protein
MASFAIIILNTFILLMVNSLTMVGFAKNILNILIFPTIISLMFILAVINFFLKYLFAN